MSQTSCVFSILKPTVDVPEHLHVDCNGRMSKLDALCEWERAYGTEHAVETMLMRGGIFVDWSDKEKSKEVLSMIVCSAHEKNLLKKWKKNSFGNKYTNQKKLACSLPQVLHTNGIRKMTRTRLNKAETLAFISSTGIFCHVGTGVCTTHQNSIRAGKWEDVLIEKQPDGEIDNEDHLGVDLNDEDNEDAMSNFSANIDYNSLYESDGISDDDEKREMTTEQKRDEAIRALAYFYGITRFKSELKWGTMKADTQRKKVAAMLKLQDALYKECAGDEWKEMKTACIRKMGQIVDCTRMEKVLESIDDRLIETPDRRGRLNLISILTGHFSEKEIIRATGVTRYYIAEAKKFALWGLDEVVNYRRVRYNFPNLKEFVSFISRPEIIVNLPKPGRSLTLSSGDVITSASVARLQSYRQIYTMFKSYLEMKGMTECSVTGGEVQEFVRTHALGYSTCVKIMEKLIPIRRVRMQCIDSFQSEALDAFENALKCVEELLQKGKIEASVATDLTRRLKVAQNYLSGYYRLHLSVYSSCASHCLVYALSDSSNEEFRRLCDHEHDEGCDQCEDVLSVFTQFKSFLSNQSTLAHSTLDIDRFRLGRMVEECVEAEKNVLEYRKHIVRGSLNELDRISTINSLTDSWALITMDFSLKLMPSGFVEAQTQWYGKCGISFHVSHVLINRGGQQAHHTLGHLNDDPKQDCVAVCFIVDHVFKVISENGIKTVIIRSDNAANYRNGGVLFTIRSIATKYGLTLSAYLFSEPQFGKGAADRQISHAKRKIVSEVNSGGYGRTAEEILTILTKAPLLRAYSFYQVRGESVKRAGCTISGITALSSFHYEESGIRVRKHDSIGGGQLVTYDSLDSIEYTYEILGEGGHLSKSADFWGDLSQEQVTERKGKKIERNTVEEDDNRSIFRCNDESCTAKYRTIGGLRKHLLVGKHVIPVHRDTVVEAAARLFAVSVETNETAFVSMQTDSFSSTNSNLRSFNFDEGWALRSRNRSTLIDPAVRRAVRRYFIERRKEGKRAEAREITRLIRNATNPSDGSYVYPLKKCLRETQAQGLITRFLKVESSKVGLKGLESGGEEENGEESDEEEGHTEIVHLPISSLDKETTTATKRGRPKKVLTSTGRKETSGQKATTGSKKAAKTPRGKNKDDSTPNIVSESNNNEEDQTAIDSVFSLNGETSKKTRGRPKKTDKEKTQRSKKEVSTDKPKEIPSTSRVTRSQKRKIEEDKMMYCEMSSDEEEDDFSVFMKNALENRAEFFTDDESDSN